MNKLLQKLLQQPLLRQANQSILYSHMKDDGEVHTWLATINLNEFSQSSEQLEDQEAIQETAVIPAPANPPVEPNNVKPQGADEEDDLAPMPNHEEYVGILHYLAIEHKQDHISRLCYNQNPELEVPENETSCWIDDPLPSEDESDSQQSIQGASIGVVCNATIRDDSSSKASSAKDILSDHIW